MGMQKGICMELKEDRSIFLLESGQFVKGQPAGCAAVGEESHFYPVSEEGVKKVRIAVWAPIIAAIAVLVLSLSVILPTEEAFAYIQVEINPGLEIGVTEKGKVISMRPLNEDGTLLIEQLEAWQDRPLNAILAQIFEASISESTEDITITTVGAAKKDKSLTYIDKMVQLVSLEIANDRISVHLKEASREDWRRSVKEHVPVGDFIEKSIPMETEQVPAPELEKPAVQKKDPARETEDTPPAQDEKQENPVKEQDDEPAQHNNRDTVPGQDKKQPTPATEVKEKPAPPAEPQPKPESKPQSEPKMKSESKPEPKPEPEPKPRSEPELKSNNGNNVPGQDKKKKHEPATEKPGNNEEGHQEKEHPSTNKDKVPGQERKPDKENGEGDSSQGNGTYGLNDKAPGRSDVPDQQKKNKDGKE